MKVAALASAIGLTGTAIAQNTDRATSNDDRSSASGQSESPSSGAIVTPEDKALGMGKSGSAVGNGEDDTSTSNDDALSVNPGPSNDEGVSVDPGQSSDEDMSVNPARPDADQASPSLATPASRDAITNGDGAIRNEENEPSPPMGSDVQPGDMGPGSMRGQ